MMVCKMEISAQYSSCATYKIFAIYSVYVNYPWVRLFPIFLSPMCVLYNIFFFENVISCSTTKYGSQTFNNQTWACFFVWRSHFPRFTRAEKIVSSFIKIFIFYWCCVRFITFTKGAKYHATSKTLAFPILQLFFWWYRHSTTTPNSTKRRKFCRLVCTHVNLKKEISYPSKKFPLYNLAQLFALLLWW